MGMDIYSTLITGLELINDGDEYNTEVLERWGILNWDKEWGEPEDACTYEHLDALATHLTEKLDFEVCVLQFGYCDNDNYIIGLQETEVTASWEIIKLDKQSYMYKRKQQEQLRILKRELESMEFNIDEKYCGLLLFPYYSH